LSAFSALLKNDRDVAPRDRDDMRPARRVFTDQVRHLRIRLDYCNSLTAQLSISRLLCMTAKLQSEPLEPGTDTHAGPYTPLLKRCVLSSLSLMDRNVGRTIYYSGQLNLTDCIVWWGLEPSAWL